MSNSWEETEHMWQADVDAQYFFVLCGYKYNALVMGTNC